jgi:ubiquinone/menaquinone biosynthesis C-methylase UbiE
MAAQPPAQPRYTHGHAEPVLRSHAWRTAENSAGYLISSLHPGLVVLDLGCGPGTITADLAGLVAPGRVVAVDSAESILARARSTCVGVGADVALAAARGERLPFRDGSFDVVHAHQVLQHVGDPVAALREMRRVCRPGGVVAARDADYAAFTWFPGVPELDEWLALYQRVARHNGGEPDAGRRLLSWARQAGFRTITPSASAWCYATDADRAWWGGLWADRLLASSFGEQAVAEGLTSRPDLERLAAGWLRWAQAPDGWLAILHGEVLCRV